MRDMDTRAKMRMWMGPFMVDTISSIVGQAKNCRFSPAEKIYLTKSTAIQ